jgi:excisionase family DNA binding protein
MKPVRDWPHEYDPKPLTIEELAKKIGRSVRTIHRLLRLGMPGEIWGKKWVFKQDAVRAWLAEQKLLAEVKCEKAS